MRALLLVLLTAGAAAAQPARVVPLDEGLALARARSAAVLQAAAAADGAEADLRALRSRLPAISAVAGAGQRYGLAFDQTTGGLTQATTEAVDVGLAADLVVFDGFERRSRARAAEASLEAARAGGLRAAHAAEAEALRGYLAVAQAEAARTVARADAEAQRALAAQVDALVAAGARPASDAAEQAERVAAARAAVVLADRDVALAEARLASLLGLDPAAAYRFPSPPDDGAAVPPPAERPDVRAAEAAVAAARAEVRATRGARLPRVALGASLGTSYTSAAPVGFDGQLADNRGGALRLRITVPLLDRGAARAATARAAARARAAEAAADDVRRGAALDVREARLRLDALLATRPLADVRAEAAAQALAAERARYAAGASTLQAVSQLQARLTAAETARAVLAVAVGFEQRLLALALGR